MILSEINIYPIKSLRGITLQKAEFDDRGLCNDRRWMLVDENDRFVTQRELPSLALIDVSLDERGLTVGCDGFGSLRVDLYAKDGILRPVTVFDSTVEGEIYDETVNEWFSEVGGKQLRLVRMPQSSRRPVSEKYRVRKTDVVSFADGYPFLLIGEASLNDLNRHLSKPVEMRRFRPNFVVQGSEAYEEDRWQDFRIGGNVFHGVKLSARCVITTVDPLKGTFDGKDPLLTLSKYRGGVLNGKRGAFFGQNVIAEAATGTVSVGDPVEVIAYAEPPVMVGHR
ncbi:MAG: MOSC domain-containing protein [Acidobacteria bacterium]|nr:MOSC domain-containing protein [Acidobacteriota bacterium]